jgi:zinc transport system substrate-binding protein
MKRLIELLLSATLCSCLILHAAAGASAEPVPVFVSILPEKTFVEKVGGSLVNVSVMVLPGANPHSYEPRPAQMGALSKARLYFAIGIGFEDAWLRKFASANPGMKIVHLDEGIEKIPMVAHHHDDGKDLPEEHQGAPDPHIWLSPPNVKKIAEKICRALIETDPSNHAAYEENLGRFQREIDSLHAHLSGLFSDKKGAKFMVFHPAWGYFARTYGLEQVPVEVEGKEPKPAQLRALIEEARREGIKVIFVQPQFSTRSAEAIAKAIGGEVVVADDLRQDWEENLRNQAERFKAALR